MSKVDTLAQTILARIRTNAYVGKIPSERALAAEFSLDFKTANRAISLLVGQGALVRRRGLGTFIAGIDRRRNLTLGLGLFKFSDPGRDPVFTRFFAGMNRAISALGVRLDVTTLGDVASPSMPADEQAARFREQALAANPDGLIYLGNVEPQLIGQLRADRPVIVATQVPESLQFDCVRRDIGSAVAQAVRRLHLLGHRRIALATYRYDHHTPSYDLTEKEGGYRAAITALGLEACVLTLTYPPEAQLAGLLRDARPRPTAVICCESTQALSLVNHAPDCGLRLPEDVAIITFDDGDMCLHTRPTLSSISAFGEELAQLAVQRLIDKLDGRITGRILETLACPFVERASSRGPAASPG